MSITNPQTLKQLGCELWWPGEKATANAPKTVTASGNATQILPFPGAGIAMFDGTGDYLKVESTDFNFGTGDFTISGWFCRKGTGTNNTRTALFGQSLITTSDDSFFTAYLNPATNMCGLTKSSVNIEASFTATIDKWYHFEVVKSGSTYYLFIDGINYITWNPQSITTDMGGIKIGRHGGLTAEVTQNDWNGFLSEIEVVNYAKHTVAFTPPRHQLQNDSNTKLLLHFNTNGTTFTDMTGKTITAYGDAKQLCSPCGSGVAYFDGTGDYLEIQHHADFNFGTSTDFTIETNIRWNVLQYSGIYTKPFGDVPGLTLYWIGNNFYVSITGVDVMIRAFTPVVGTLYHIALVRRSGVYSFYLDGNLQGATLSNTTNINSTGNLQIGLRNNGYLNGNLSEFRVSNVARYTSNFTPSTQPFKPDSYTKLLLHMDGVGQAFADYSDTPVDNGFAILPAGCTITPNGTFATVKGKDGRTYVKFDGSTNYINISDNNAWYLGAQDYTLIFWVNPAANTVYICGQASSDGNTISWYMSYWSDAKFHFRSWPSATELLSTSTYSTGTWYHVAITRKGTLRSIYINGILSNTDTNSDAIPDLSYMFAIGAAGQYTGNRMNGIIKDLQLIKGTALSYEQINQIIDETFIY